jgi:hypothetical protein
MSKINKDDIIETKSFNFNQQKDPFAPLCIRTQRKADLLVLNKDFMGYVKELRTSFDIPVGKNGYLLADQGKALDWWRKVQRPRFAEWDKAISVLLTRCNLLSGWREAIEWYVICAVDNRRLIAPYSMMVTNGLDKFGNVELKIVVNDYSAVDDAKYVHNLLVAWRTYLGYQKSHQIAKPMPRFKYYVRMLELRKLNNDDKQIADLLNQEFTDDNEPTFTPKIVHDDLVFISKRIAAQMS